MAHHKTGAARNQITFSSLEEAIAADNIVRVIDAFCDIVDYEGIGFAHIKPKNNGTPPYHPALLLKIYLYGYLNRVRSSRKLEAECVRNIEMQWLCGRLVPCYHTICTFRSYKETFVNAQTGDKTTINHRVALKEVFRAFNRFLNGQDLFGKETAATDGTKIRAQNAKKKNYTEDKLNKKIALSDANIAKYLEELDEFDTTDAQSAQQDALKAYTQNKLDELKIWRDKFVEFKDELKRRQAIDPEVTQISTTDPDARSIVINNSGHAEVSFNVLTAVDDKHNLIAHFFTDNIKDTTLLAESLIATKAEFDNDFAADLHKIVENRAENSVCTEGAPSSDSSNSSNSSDSSNSTPNSVDLSTKLNPKSTLNGLADKGFHAATQLHECKINGIITYVAVPNLAYSGKDKDFTILNFTYNQTNDTYTCPSNQTLKTNGEWYDKKNRHGVVVTRYKNYTMSPATCAACPFAHKCLSKTAIKYRTSRKLERPECQDAVIENKKRVDTLEGKLIYKRRQAIVEHPYGIIKRQWDCAYTLLRGIDKVNAEFAIVFTCYNLRRAVSVLSVKTLLERLELVKDKINATMKAFFRGILSHTQFFNTTINAVFCFA